MLSVMYANGMWQVTNRTNSFFFQTDNENTLWYYLNSF